MKKVYGMLSVIVGASLLMGGQAFAAGHGEGKEKHHGDHHHSHRHHNDQMININDLPEDIQNLIRQAYVDRHSDVQPDNEKKYTPVKKEYSQPVAAEPKQPTVKEPEAAQPQPDVAEPKQPTVKEPEAAQPQPVEAKPAQNATANDTASQVIAAGEKYKGTPYKFGSSSSTTQTFDCSSFTQRAFKDVGISLPRDSRQQSTVGQAVSIDQLQKGDLVFFRTSGSSSDRITHVAIYAGNDQLLHTFGKPGVTYTKFSGTNWEKRFVTARRVI